jgi:heavy metal sensor kinase
LRRLSVRWKLTFLYVGTVVTILAVFISADMLELRHDYARYVRDGAMLPAEMAGAWREAIWEHILMASILTVAVLAMGYVFIRKALGPVRDMTGTARSITAEDLSLRVDAHGDTDEIGELARTLNEMIGRLEQSFDQAKRFSGDAAHELNTPLTVLKGEIEIALRKDRPAGEYRAVLLRLLEEVEHLSAIVDNLLFLSVSREGARPASADPVAIDRVVMDAYEEVLPAAREKGVGFELEKLEEVQRPGDEPLLRRMVANLLANAVKFTPSGGRVAVSLCTAASGPRLKVSDNGIGIPAEQVPHIFERFYRADKSRSARTGGSGLGLAIVKDIADRHGLLVNVSSEPGRGTEVTVAWPSEMHHE